MKILWKDCCVDRTAWLNRNLHPVDEAGQKPTDASIRTTVIRRVANSRDGAVGIFGHRKLLSLGNWIADANKSPRMSSKYVFLSGSPLWIAPSYRYIWGGQPGPISQRMMQPLLHRSHIELNILRGEYTCIFRLTFVHNRGRLQCCEITTRNI